MGPVWAETVDPIKARTAREANRRRENKGIFLRKRFFSG
jgi:hypothetical protein